MSRKKPTMQAEFQAELQNMGLNVRAFRQEKNLKQRELAERVELSITSISQIETGKHKPDLQRLYMMAHALGKELSDFFQPAAEGNTKRVRHAESSPQAERPEPAPP